jgi:hypothetical protein
MVNINNTGYVLDTYLRLSSLCRANICSELKFARTAHDCRKACYQMQILQDRKREPANKTRMPVGKYIILDGAFRIHWPSTVNVTTCKREVYWNTIMQKKIRNEFAMEEFMKLYSSPDLDDEDTLTKKYPKEYKRIKDNWDHALQAATAWYFEMCLGKEGATKKIVEASNKAGESKSKRKNLELMDAKSFITGHLLPAEEHLTALRAIRKEDLVCGVHYIKGKICTYKNEIKWNALN